jgi:hypothetical protein
MLGHIFRTGQFQVAGMTKNDSPSTASEAVSQLTNSCAAHDSSQSARETGKNGPHFRVFTSYKTVKRHRHFCKDFPHTFLLFDNAEAKAGYLSGRNEFFSLEFDLAVQMIDEPDAIAEYERCQVDDNLINQTGFETLLVNTCPD